MILALIFGIILGTGLTIFTLENASIITVSMLSYQVTAPLALILISVIGAAIVMTLMGILPSFLRVERSVRKLQADKKVLENELAKYQLTIPVAPAAGARSFVLEPERVV